MEYCCFIGPEKLSPEAEERERSSLLKAIDHVLSKGIYDFIYSGGTGFELLAFELLLDLKSQNTGIGINIFLSSPKAIWEDMAIATHRARVERIKSCSAASIDTIAGSSELYARQLGIVGICRYCIVKPSVGYLPKLLFEYAQKNKKDIFITNTQRTRSLNDS